MRPTKRPTASSPEPPRPTFGAEDLVAALSELATKQQVTDGLTSIEWMDVTGWTPGRINKTLRLLHRAGRLRGSRVQRAAIDGSMRWVSAYAIVPK